MPRVGWQARSDRHASHLTVSCGKTGLQPEETFVQATACQQLAVRASLADRAMMKHENLIRSQDSAEPVSDGDRRPLFGEQGEGALNVCLNLAIHCAGRFVQQKKRWIGCDRARK